MSRPMIFHPQCQRCRRTSRRPPTSGERSAEVWFKGNAGTFFKIRSRQGCGVGWFFCCCCLVVFFFPRLFWFGFRRWQREESGLTGAGLSCLLLPPPPPSCCCFVLRRGLGRRELVNCAGGFGAEVRSEVYKHDLRLCRKRLSCKVEVATN